MNGYERITAMLAGRPVDHLPLMPITMMFAGDQLGVPYRMYVSDYAVLVEAQIRTAEKFGFDYVSCISDPTREAAECGARIQWFDNQPPAIDENNALLADKEVLVGLKSPDPLAGGRMYDRVQAAALFRQRVGGQYLIEGWIEGPCAEAADLRGINRLMLDFYDDPQFVRDLFEFVLEIVDLDYMVSVGKARQAMGSQPVLTGNLDPVRTLRNGTPEIIQQALAQCHQEAGPRYIVAAGCEVPRDTPEANVHALREYAQTHKPNDTE